MFKLKLWMTPLLCLVVGAALVFVGTTYLHDHLIPPFERELDAYKTGIRGVFATDLGHAGTAAARISDLSEARTAVGLAAESGLPGEILEKAGGALGAPAFALIANPAGQVVKRVGEIATLGDDIAGLPVFAEALTGVIRDDFLRAGEDSFVVVGAPIVKDRKAAGAVVLGFKIDGAYVDRVAEAMGIPVVALDQGKKIGSALPDATGETLKLAVAVDTFGDLELSLPVAIPIPLPLFVQDTRRYIAAGAPMYVGSNAPVLVPVLDRNAAFNLIAQAQLFVAGASTLLAVLLAALVLSILSSISRPLDVLMEHLGQYAQGAGVGILPEAALSGPFVRLGKQINMIIQAPPVGAGPRPGSPPVTPVGRPPTGAFSLDEMSAPSPTAGLGGMAPPPPPDDELRFEGIPGLDNDAPPVPPPATSTPPFGFGRPTTPPASPPPPPGGMGMGAALPGMGGGMAMPPAPPADDDEPPAGLPGSGLAGLFDDAAPDPLAAFRVGGGQPARPSAPPPAAPPPAAAAGYNPDATVMFQVPQELIQESALTSQSGRAVVEAPREDRTVVAQVPPELLNRTAPKQSVASAEDAHYREVYKEFIQTREQCGEDVDQLTYEKFLQKLMKNREQIIEKYASKSVRFQVYVKQGKAALRAVPVRE